MVNNRKLENNSSQIKKLIIQNGRKNRNQKKKLENEFRKLKTLYKLKSQVMQVFI